MNRCGNGQCRTDHQAHAANFCRSADLLLLTRSNEVVGIPCAPFALGLLVTGLLAGGITTSPLTSTYPWVRSEPMSTNPARSLRKVSHGDLLSPPFCARSSVSLRSGGSILQSKAGPFLASCEGHFIESAEELYSTAAHSTSWAKLPKGRSFSAIVYLRAPALYSFSNDPAKRNRAKSGRV